jgi:hypothetical protein
MQVEIPIINKNSLKLLQIEKPKRTDGDGMLLP